MSKYPLRHAPIPALLFKMCGKCFFSLKQNQFKASATWLSNLYFTWQQNEATLHDNKTASVTETTTSGLLIRKNQSILYCQRYRNHNLRFTNSKKSKHTYCQRYRNNTLRFTNLEDSKHSYCQCYRNHTLKFTNSEDSKYTYCQRYRNHTLRFTNLEDSKDSSCSILTVWSLLWLSAPNICAPVSVNKIYIFQCHQFFAFLTICLIASVVVLSNLFLL